VTPTGASKNGISNQMDVSEDELLWGYPGENDNENKKKMLYMPCKLTF
jgi:hypothetical protein